MNINYLSRELLFSLIIALVLGKIIIPILNRQSIGQNVSEYGPESHLKKQGTPTMGGIIIFLTLLIGVIVFQLFSKEMIVALIACFGFGIIGFIDDFLMLIMKRAEGLTPKQKMALQIVLSILVTYLIKTWLPDNFAIYKVPFIGKEVRLEVLSYFLYPLVLVASANAVNLTDGLDGLVSSVSLPVFFFLGFVSKQSSLLNEFSAIMIGSLLGFLAYNTHKASVFMGDTGSMTIGGAVGILSILTGYTLYLPIFGIIYVIEAGSVIIQVISYKTRNKKRVFLMTPIHHHFELKGFNEQKIVTNFTIVTVIAVLVSILI